jgi:hypothetical protein
MNKHPANPYRLISLKLIPDIVYEIRKPVGIAIAHVSQWLSALNSLGVGVYAFFYVEPEETRYILAYIALGFLLVSLGFYLYVDAWRGYHQKVLKRWADYIHRFDYQEVDELQKALRVRNELQP